MQSRTLATALLAFGLLAPLSLGLAETSISNAAEDPLLPVLADAGGPEAAAPAPSLPFPPIFSCPNLNNVVNFDYWCLNGNPGTTPGVHFVGTTDAKDLWLKVNGQRALLIDETGGSPNLVGGYSGNAAVGGPVGATIAGGGDSGAPNTVAASYAAVGGGRANTASQAGAAVAGGLRNTASGFYALVGSGQENTASNDWSAVAGGLRNQASNRLAFVGGGQQNTASGDTSTAVGGSLNTAGGSTSFVGAGSGNTASGASSSVVGGTSNTASSLYGAVGGGTLNSVVGDRSTVAGGDSNKANGIAVAIGGGKGNVAGSQFTTGEGYDAIGGGLDNFATNGKSTVGGGEKNNATGPYTTVAGGQANKATTQHAAIGGGFSNQASGSFATVAGGQNNIASAQHATVGGGNFNKASGTWATIPGGDQNTASGQHSLAAGLGATAAHTGSFVWNADHSSFTTIGSTAQDQFTARAVGGFRFITSTNPAIGCFIPSGAMTCSSDRNVKMDIESVNPRLVLSAVASMPISEWSYVTEPGVRHLGPMAQDFHAAFGLGADDTHIGMLDEGGVALAAVQGLYAELQEKSDRIAQLEARLAALEGMLAQP